MHHSFHKLENLLATKGFYPLNIFVIDGYCVYVEVSNKYTGDTFLLYISSKFNIKPEKGNIYKIKYVDIEDSSNVVSKYAEEPDKYDIKQDYNEVNIENDDENVDLEKSLNENYNREVLLKDINKDDKDILKDIFRQLNRFTFCVQNIKYKLSILYKNYLCSIKKDDTIECYYIQNFPVNNCRKLYISIDLKFFYEKIDNVSNDIKCVKDSIYSILDQNQLKHSKILGDMLESKDKLISYSTLIYKKKEYYKQYIAELESMLSKLNESEIQLNEEKNKIASNTGDYGLKGVHTDIQNSHSLFKLQKKIDTLYELKNEVAQDLDKTRLEQENITLEIDKILFDNSIMLNQIIKNFNSITQILE